MSTVITFGTFDVLHVGHLNLLEQARRLGDRLVVGVSSDSLSLRKKGRSPVFSEAERLRLVFALKCVDGVFTEHALELKREYIIRNAANILVMGDDWAGKFDEMTSVCDVRYLPRTPSVSTTETIERIRLG